jgi:myosin heavy subunit
MFTINVYPVIISCIYQERERYKLGDPRTFHYLNQSKCIKLEGLDESKEYLETRKAMDIIGISSEEQVLILLHFLFFPLYEISWSLPLTTCSCFI